jgi:hypothetical protein
MLKRKILSSSSAITVAALWKRKISSSSSEDFKMANS